MISEGIIPLSEVLEIVREWGAGHRLLARQSYAHGGGLVRLCGGVAAIQPDGARTRILFIRSDGDSGREFWYRAFKVLASMCAPVVYVVVGVPDDYKRILSIALEAGYCVSLESTMFLCRCDLSLRQNILHRIKRQREFADRVVGRLGIETVRFASLTQNQIDQFRADANEFPDCFHPFDDIENDWSISLVCIQEGRIVAYIAACRHGGSALEVRQLGESSRVRGHGAFAVLLVRLIEMLCMADSPFVNVVFDVVRDNVPMGALTDNALLSPVITGRRNRCLVSYK